jgi:hypothetical protein
VTAFLHKSKVQNSSTVKLAYRKFRFHDSFVTIFHCISPKTCGVSDKSLYKKGKNMITVLVYKRHSFAR